ncbi:MAG: UDP-N-acetylmuramoyl-L-alanyl-D-glutamate--2,6-diaminopimelate ligase [Eubacteriales bacterium]|nr:UDP-N-acetylmuramoyl-L-alanyl-D-glutamate--2,6-diaminopimelate ligase [Clostridiales bacterium]MDY5836276.1 UDP-N-acetylmuramoyl-L-alanyl-D-glutamate--2,6-diaminopimelate ligase [Eubacteriales bacterium]
MTFNELIASIPVQDQIASHWGRTDLLSREVQDLAYDSRNLAKGQAFFALAGRSQDAAIYLAQAWKAGAFLLVGQAGLNRVAELMAVEGIESYNYLQVRSGRQALALASASFFGQPAKHLTLVGITGTKGKTSVAHLISQSLNALGAPCLLIGTTGIVFKDQVLSTPNTTPESYLIHKYLAQALAQGASQVVMELSSQGLAMDRAYGLEFDLGIFLNLGRDHIGPKEHESWEDYRAAKAKIFSLSKKALINADDSQASYMAELAQTSLLPPMPSIYYYSSQEDQILPSDHVYQAQEVRQNADEISFQFEGQGLTLRPGAHFLLENSMAALAALDILGFPPSQTASLVGQAHVPGRLESLANDLGASIIIDYAHNGLSLENLLSSLKALHPRRLLLLIGSVGGKSKERRRELAEVGEKYADWVYVTSDNPDYEDPLAIAEEIASYFSPSFHHFTVEPDRARAIRLAVHDLQEGDCLALCGKGHEDFQLIKGQKIPLDEKALVRAALRDK